MKPLHLWLMETHPSKRFPKKVITRFLILLTLQILKMGILGQIRIIQNQKGKPKLVIPTRRGTPTKPPQSAALHVPQSVQQTERITSIKADLYVVQYSNLKLQSTSMSANDGAASSSNASAEVQPVVPDGPYQYGDPKDGNRRRERDEEFKEGMEKAKESHLIVAALIATVTFTAAFTLPGGVIQDGDKDEGTAILSKKAAFQAFVITDAIAPGTLLICCLCILPYVTGGRY